MTTDTLTPLLRGALVPTGVVGALVVVGAGLVVGQTGVAGAGVGVVLVLAFFSASILVLRAARGAQPMIFFALALTVFALKVLALAIALGVVARTDLPDQVLHRGALAAAVIATALVWIAAETRAFVRMRVPIFDLDSGRGSDDKQSSP